MNSEMTALVFILMSMAVSGAATMAYYIQRTLIDPNLSFTGKKLK